ncbi:amino acid adenylation domain-containing protein [Brasilonema sp. CT11]|nr:amino acid adenylation domain-containing protein [Brasilonema sp. CT11]
MNTVEFLQDIIIEGWQLWSDGERLCYDAPKEEATSSVLNQLKQHKTEILQLLRDRPDIFSVYPLSYGQKALWFLWQLAPDSVAYNLAVTARIYSQVDVTILHKAFEILIQRHSVLRSTFPKRSKEPMTQVHQNQKVDFQQIDASTWCEEDLNQKVLREHRHPFDLKREPIIRVRLFTRSKQEHILLLTIHHIVFDGWSVGILLEELRRLYPALKNGVQPSLAPLKHSYCDYVRWQQEMLAVAKGEQLWSYWQQKLSGDLPILNLPTDKLRPPIQTYNGASHPFQLSEKLTERLKKLAQSEGATLYMMLLAAFQVLLYRYTAQEDILVGSPTLGRTKPEFASIVGYFVNPVVIRANLSGNPSFKVFLAQVRQTVLEALAHQDYPFALLVEQLQPQRDPSRSPIFQVSFNLLVQRSQEGQKLPFRETKTLVDCGGLELAPFDISHQEGQFDLSLEMAEASSSIIGVIKYNTDLFNKEMIARMVGHFQTLLKGIVTNPELPVSQLPLLTEDERHQLLVEWNQTAADYSQDKCIHQLFEEQVELTPSAVAVEFGNEQLTYQQLNERANQLAHYLQSLGVEPEVFVGLSVERSLEMAISVLAILKAGGAYVPLDPAYPQQRLAFMLEDTRSKVLLTQQKLRSLFPESVADVVCLDQQSEIIAQQPSTNPKSPVGLSNLLYVIYTSGSTGQPKGITLSHQALGNLIHWHLETMEHGVGVLQFASLSFDASFHEMFAAWCSGSTLYMISEALRLDVEKLVHFLAEKPVQKVILPVALWQQIAQVYGQQAHLFRHLTEVVTTGEQLQITQPIIDLFKQLNHCQLHNHYGPSETHVVTSFTFNSSPDTWPVYPPIGKPIANTQIYILDQHWQPVPIGVPGFLFIGGANLARGYLNRPNLTAQKFVSNPFGKGQLYQTGDIARYLPDGNIEFLGRVDDQVKVRGFRIELGEVEAVLNKHPQLSQAVVTVQGNAANEKRLVAYVVPKQGDTVTAEQLRQFLQQKLPEYAIPSAFVLLESLPLTPNQKVDRRALPTLDLDLSNSKEYIPPRTPTEEIIADIFAAILKLEQVGVYSNFFELGGHSLLATQVVSRLRETFQVELPLRTLFESPTVAELERVIAALLMTDSRLVIPEIKPVARDSEHLPLSWAQERLWFLDGLQSESAAYNMPAALQMTGQLNAEALELALTEIIQRHSVLRTTFPIVNGTPVQAIAPTKVVTIPVFDLQSLSPDEQADRVQQLATEEAQQPFDLANGPVIRFKLLQLAQQTHVLLVTLHHIVFDAWSISIFIRELVALYEVSLHQQPCVLPALPIQYTDFACWQRQWLQGEMLETQLNYWKQQLGGNLPVLQLPIDYPHSPTQNYQGAQQVLRLPNSLTTALKTLSRQEGVTVFMTLLAAFKVLLSRHSGQEDIIVGSPIAGRNHLGTEELIGFFLNTLPLRTYLGGNPSFRQLLTKVREITLAAYSHQDIPFEKLVEELRPERSLSRHPVFDVMFNMINTPEVALEIPGLTFEPLELTQPESKFFLTVFVQEAAESLNIKLVYRQNLFSSERMTAFLEQFEHLLQQIVAEPERSIQSYFLVTPQSRSLLPEPSAPLDEPDYEPVTALFANWAQQAPQQTAIRQNGRTWSYQELSESAHTIAEVLLSCGVQPKDVVALCGSRSFGLIASMLGVFLSGAVLLLVDSNLPTARQQLMLEQAQAKYLLVVGTQSKQASVTENSLEIIHVDSETATAIAPIPGTSRITSLPTLTPGDRAYIFFTSGSTGTPKGVLGTHKGISHFLDWQRQTFEIGTNDRVAQLTSLTFDAVLRDVFLPLTSGATLCLPNQDNDFGIDGVLNWLETEQITVVHTVPALAQSWLTQVPEEIHLRSLRWIFFSGELLTGTLVRQWRQTFPEAGQVVNLYGATETTMVKCFYRVPSEIPSGVMPAGWALPQTQALVLNLTNQLCGIGEIGEIIIRTPFRTLGYINAVQEQQQRFVPNPLSNDQQDLFYYTGDKGRYRPDGSVEVLGRLDDQIKIRGIRVQPGEIETVLNQHPAVAESVVIAIEQTLGDKRLVAYVVAKLNQTFAEGDLRYFLKQQLPEYLVPSIFVVLDALPLTPNGKVNRRALPAPSVQVGKSASNVPPRTPTEEVIVNIFAEVLKLQHLGVDDNFFELGGHSLLATQVVSRIQEALKVNLPLRTLFEAPTPAELTVAIEKMKVTRGAEIDTPKITKISRERHRVQISSQEELTLPDTVRQKIFKSESKH